MGNIKRIQNKRLIASFNNISVTFWEIIKREIHGTGLVRVIIVGLTTPFHSGLRLPSIYLYLVTKVEICNVIGTLKNLSLFGHESVPVQIVKECVDALRPILCKHK